MKFILDPNHPPKHSLTSEERTFLQKLASHKLQLDKSLVFQINDLQRHTELVLSGELLPDDSFFDTAKIEQEMGEVDKLIEGYASKIERGEMPQDERDEMIELLALWKTQRTALQNVLDNPERNAKWHSPFGVYSNNGNHSRVTLFVDAFWDKVDDPYKAILLMGQVLLHEYFHSFYAHVGVGALPPFSHIEEPMAEFGSLAFLYSMSASQSSVAKQAHDAMRYALGTDKKKQPCVGMGATYKYGRYLFDNFCGYYPDLIARYANVSSLLDGQTIEAVEFKYMLYPTYPTSSYIEDVVLYGRIEELMSQGENGVMF